MRDLGRKGGQARGRNEGPADLAQDAKLRALARDVYERALLGGNVSSSELAAATKLLSYSPEKPPAESEPILSAAALDRKVYTLAELRAFADERGIGDDARITLPVPPEVREVLLDIARDFSRADTEEGVRRFTEQVGRYPTTAPAIFARALTNESLRNELFAHSRVREAVLEAARHIEARSDWPSDPPNEGVVNV